MVEDELTDGRRIAQLLSSELTGLSRGPLAEVSVVDADPDVTPTVSGTVAYAIEYDGDRIGTVSVTPDATLLSVDRPLPPEHLQARSDVSVGDSPGDVRIERGAAVKAAVDALLAALESA